MLVVAVAHEASLLRVAVDLAGPCSRSSQKTSDRQTPINLSLKL